MFLIGLETHVISLEMFLQWIYARVTTHFRKGDLQHFKQRFLETCFGREVIWVCYCLSSVKEKERFRQVTKSKSMPKMESKISHFTSGQRILLTLHIHLTLDATERKRPKWMKQKLHIPHNVLLLNLLCLTVKLLLSKMQQLRAIILFISVLLHSQIHNSLFKYSLLKMRYNWEGRHAD